MSFHPQMEYAPARFHRSERKLAVEGEAFAYTSENQKKFDENVARYPADQRKSAILYALYLANFATARVAAGNADIGAVVLFVLWVYYTAFVFLLGGVVAETWELRRMQHRQRAVLE